MFDDQRRRTRGSWFGDRRRRAVAVLTVTLAVGGVASGIAAPDAQSRQLVACSPSAQVPLVYTDLTARAVADVSYCSSGWNYTIRLKNRAGSTIWEDVGYSPAYNGTTTIVGSRKSCAGAYVHTFFYMNVGGTGKSDTSGETSSCAY